MTEAYATVRVTDALLDFKLVCDDCKRTMHVTSANPKAAIRIYLRQFLRSHAMGDNTFRIPTDLLGQYGILCGECYSGDKEEGSGKVQ